jgi:GH25 family lysozyme M1 (1,4-beta-N-acetylmuramidase)
MSFYAIDISNNSGEVDMGRIKAAGYTAVYLKATEGTTMQDSYMNEYYEQARAAGLKVGAYHFLVGTSSPITQAQNFYSMIKDKEWDMLPVLDDETPFDEVCDYTVRFIDTFKMLCPWELCLYSYTSFINEHFDSILGSIQEMKVWLADYTGIEWRHGSIKFPNIVGHQYSETGSVDGVNKQCDLDVFTESIFMGDDAKTGEWIQGESINHDKWWYKYSDGTYPADCWKKINGKWYLFDKNGWMLHDWKSDGGIWYFLGSPDDGAMKTGWQLISGKWYYFNEEGAMQTCWKKINGEWYYFDSNGAMMTGWIHSGAYDYLLDSQGVMYSNCEAYGYSFNSDGVATKL